MVCNHDDKLLFVAIDVRDDRLVAKPRGERGDHLTIRLGRSTLTHLSIETCGA